MACQVENSTSTLPVTVDDIIYHGRAVSRGLSRALLMLDMPFMSYQAEPAEAIRNAGRLLAQGGAQHGCDLDGMMRVIINHQSALRAGSAHFHPPPGAGVPLENLGSILLWNAKLLRKSESEFGVLLHMSPRSG